MTVVADGRKGTVAQSMIDRFTAIVDVFDGSTCLSLDSVALRARLPRSTTHRILDHLVRRDWIAHSEAGYRLGRRALSWGAADAADLRLRTAAAPVLSRLHVTTSAVVHLGVLDRGWVIHLDKWSDSTHFDTVPSSGRGSRVGAPHGSRCGDLGRADTGGSRRAPPRRRGGRRADLRATSGIAPSTPVRRRAPSR